MKLLRYVILPVFMAVLISSCTTTSSVYNAKHEFPNFHGSFYAINGWWGDLPFIGYGMNNLQKKVTGYNVAFSRHAETMIKNTIIKNHKEGTLDRPLVLVGHSLGGNAVIRIATALDKYGIDVDYMGVVDAPRPGPIPDNVRVVDNFLIDPQKNGVGRKLTRGNIVWLNDTSHIRMGNDKRLHDQVLKRIRAALTSN